MPSTSNYKERFSEYLKQIRVIAAMAIVLAGAVWASRHPSVWTIVAPIIVLALIFGDAWVYGSPRKESLALSHPQS